jgi:hypothetical protein
MVDRYDHQSDGTAGTAVSELNERRRRRPSSDSDERPEEVLELHEIPTGEDGEIDDAASISSGEYRVTTRRTVSRTITRTSRSREERRGLWGWIWRFWTRNVVLTVSQKSNRDHFGGSYKTFVPGWLFSIILSHFIQS